MTSGFLNIKICCWIQLYKMFQELLVNLKIQTEIFRLLEGDIKL